MDEVQMELQVVMDSLQEKGLLWCLKQTILKGMVIYDQI